MKYEDILLQQSNIVILQKLNALVLIGYNINRVCNHWVIQFTE